MPRSSRGARTHDWRGKAVVLGISFWRGHPKLLNLPLFFFLFFCSSFSSFSSCALVSFLLFSSSTSLYLPLPSSTFLFLSVTGTTTVTFPMRTSVRRLLATSQEAPRPNKCSASRMITRRGKAVVMYISFCIMRFNLFNLPLFLCSSCALLVLFLCSSCALFFFHLLFLLNAVLNYAKNSSSWCTSGFRTTTECDARKATS